MSKRNRNKSKTRDTPPPQLQNKTPPGLTIDSFMNIAARLGTGTPNMLDATQYPLTRLTQQWQLMNSLYRSHWVIRRIIDVIPEDMCKNWWKLSTQLTPDQIDRFDKLSKRIKPKILEGLKWGRLYGGAAGIMLIKGHEDILDQPLDLDTVWPGSFNGLLIVDRWSGIYPGIDLITDTSDSEYGLPDYYEVRSQSMPGTVKIHHSRVIRFEGRPLPNWEKQAEIYWGASEIEHVYDELKKRDNTSFNIANLVFRANLSVLKQEGMGQLLSSTNDKVQQDFYNTMQAQNWLMNNFSLFLLGEKDDYTTHQFTFSGLDKVYENFMMDLAGAAEMPITKLFGRSPAGMNATGESDMQNYYDTIEEKQEAYLSPVIDKLLPVMCMSEFGAIPDDLDYKYNPVRRSNDQQKADLGVKNTEAILSAYNAGLISQQTALKELRQLEETTGLWSNITDEDINNANNSVVAAGEFGLGGDILGGPLGTEETNRNPVPGQPDPIT